MGKDKSRERKTPLWRWQIVAVCVWWERSDTPWKRENVCTSFFFFWIALIIRCCEWGKFLHLEFLILCKQHKTNTSTTCIVQLVAVSSHTVMQHKNSHHTNASLQSRLQWPVVHLTPGLLQYYDQPWIGRPSKTTGTNIGGERGHPSVYSLKRAAQAVLCRAPQAVTLETFKERG